MAEAEHAMIARLLAPLSNGLKGSFGLLDDAACLSPPADSEFVVTMDTLVHDVHFLFDGTPSSAASAARKALAVNVSDLAAKGAEPYAYFLSMALPEGHESWLQGLVAGLAEAQAGFGLTLAGGDTVRTSGPLTLTITAIGNVPSGQMIKRSGARSGDAVMVSGTIGDALLGLKLAGEDESARSWHEIISAKDAKPLNSRNLSPLPRVALIPALRRYATAALDVSDGLAIDASRLAAASGLSFDINADLIPRSEPCKALMEAGLVQLEDLIAGGDDYEILLTIRPQDETAFTKAAKSAGVEVTRIGQAIDGSGLVVRDRDGKSLRLDRLGWDHLA